MGADRRCALDGCDRPYYARGWCGMHYKRWRRHGDPLVVTRGPGSARCRVRGCERPSSARGWCHGHYQRWWRNGDVTPDVPLGRDRRQTGCQVDGCDRKVHARGLCQAHYVRMRTRGDVAADVPVRVTTGGGSISHGYWKVPVPPHLRHLTNGATSTTEHRLVMAMLLGRPLEDDEVVHHRNGDRLDNRPENLELWSTMQPKGQRVEDKVAFALAILRRYRPDLLVDGAGPPAPQDPP